jgi:hypothetical protein
MAAYALKRYRVLQIRKQFADERQNHAASSLDDVSVRALWVWSSICGLWKNDRRLLPCDSEWRDFEKESGQGG